jgi:hypothetical protein
VADVSKLGEGVCDARYGRLVSLGLLRREINELHAEEIRFVECGGWWSRGLSTYGSAERSRWVVTSIAEILDYWRCYKDYKILAKM